MVLRSAADAETPNNCQRRPARRCISEAMGVRARLKKRPKAWGRTGAPAIPRLTRMACGTMHSGASTGLRVSVQEQVASWYAALSTRLAAEGQERSALRSPLLFTVAFAELQRPLRMCLAFHVQPCARG